MSLEGTGYEGLNSHISEYGVVVSPCEHDNEPLISRIGGELLTTLSDCKLLQGHVTFEAPVSISTFGQVTISDNSSGWYHDSTQF
jgi:hypothetical protein